MKKVSAQQIISKEFCDSLVLKPSSQSVSILLSLIQSAISVDYRCLRRFVRVLKKQESLIAVAESLITNYRKLHCMDNLALTLEILTLLLVLRWVTVSC